MARNGEAGQVWTLLRDGSQYHVLIVSNDEYNGVAELVSRA